MELQVASIAISTINYQCICCTDSILSLNGVNNVKDTLYRRLYDAYIHKINGVFGDLFGFICIYLYLLGIMY